MLIWKKAIVVATLLTALFAPSALNAAPVSYKISAVIAAAGKELGKPTVAVKAGEPASVSVSGDNGYRLELTVSESGPGTVEVVTHLNASAGSVATTVVTPIGRAVVVATDALNLQITVQPGGG